MSISLTESQNIVFQYVKEFLQREFDSADPESFVTTITGQAGTGKTTITKHILQYARGKLKQTVTAVAPTHKARKVLDRVLNTGTFMSVQTITVACLLSKMKGHSYIGTKRYVSDGNHKLNMADVFIIDEASMITDADFDDIVQLAIAWEKKLIFIGDAAQIPNPAQPMSLINSELIKSDSKAFRVSNLQTLSGVMRQGQDNPLLEVCSLFRGDLRVPVIVPHETKLNSRNQGVEFIDDRREFEKRIKSAVLRTAANPNVRIIAYTNNSVNEWNKLIVGKESDFKQGDLIMGYTNGDFIENGQDYLVADVTLTTTHSIELPMQSFHMLTGQIVGLRNTDCHVERHIFIPNIDDPANEEVLSELVERAEQVNKLGSSKKDYHKYMELKSQLIFASCVFKFNGMIMTATEFKSGHPLLFTKVWDIISESNGKRTVVRNQLMQQINSRYPQLIQDRASDSKPLGDTECFADKFQIIDKDIDFGYAITAHKSQGSTFSEVFIDEADFNKLKDCWNFKLNHKENRIKEKNQLLYVAYSRPTQRAIIYSVVDPTVP